MLVLVLVEAGVCIRAAAADRDDAPGVVVPVNVRDDDLFGLGEDTALVSDSKKDDMVIYVFEIVKRCSQWVGNVPYLLPRTQDVSVMRKMTLHIGIVNSRTMSYIV